MTGETRAPVVAIGIGNETMGDDGLGAAVVRRLSPGRAVEVLVQTGEATRLLDALAGRRAAVIVDAARDGPAGTVQRFDVASAALPAGLSGASTHGFGVAEGIELARSLGRLPAECIVYAMRGKAFEPHGGLSPEVQAVLPELARAVAAELVNMTRKAEEGRDA